MKAQQQTARRRTMATIDEIEADIIASYSQARAAVVAEIEQLYTRVLNGVSPEDYYNVAIRNDRLKSMLRRIDDILAAAHGDSDAMVREASRLAFEQAHNLNQYILDWFSPLDGLDLSFFALPRELVTLSVEGNLKNWERIDALKRQEIQRVYGNPVNYVPRERGTLTQILLSNKRQTIRRVNRSITEGLVAGKSFRETARDVSRIVGQATDAGNTGAMARALRIVRTETHRTYNAGQYASAKAAAAQGLPIQRTIVAALDSRTRAQSQRVDGQTVGVDEPFIYPGGRRVMYPGNSGVAAWDINDRETVVNTIRGVPPEARVGVNPVTGETEVFDWTTYPEWAAANGMRQDKNGRWR